MDHVDLVVPRRSAEGLLTEFINRLGQAPGGKWRATEYWLTLLGINTVSQEDVDKYLASWDHYGLRRFGRWGALCLARDALTNNDMVRFAAICHFGLSLEA
jgi:hypothetical protein